LQVVAKIVWCNTAFFKVVFYVHIVQERNCLRCIGLMLTKIAMHNQVAFLVITGLLSQIKRTLVTTFDPCNCSLKILLSRVLAINIFIALSERA
jgi:hypothetical protein